MTFDDVQRRIGELSRPVAKRTALTLESLLDRLETALDAATADNAHSAVMQAIGLGAKLRELMRAEAAEQSLENIKDLRGVAEMLLNVGSGDLGHALAMLDELKELMTEVASERAELIPAGSADG